MSLMEVGEGALKYNGLGGLTFVKSHNQPEQ